MKSLRAAIALGASITSIGDLAAQEFPMPYLFGTSREEAIETLRSLHLHFGVDTLDNCSNKNSVSLQQPLAGAPVKAGDLVLIWINRDDGVRIPGVVGKDLEEAVATVKAEGLEPRPVEIYKEFGSTGKCNDYGLIDYGVREPVVRSAPTEGTFICRVKGGTPGIVELAREHLWRRNPIPIKLGELCP